MAITRQEIEHIAVLARLDSTGGIFDRLAEEALLRLKAQRDPGKDGVPENRFFPSALVERASIRKEYGITPGEDGQAKEKERRQEK